MFVCVYCYNCVICLLTHINHRFEKLFNINGKGVSTVTLQQEGPGFESIGSIVSVSAVEQTGNLSRVYPTSHPMIAGFAPSDRGWVDGEIEISRS